MNGLAYTNIQTYLQNYSSDLAKGNSERNIWLKQLGIEDELKDLSRGLFGSATYLQIKNNGVYIHSYASVPTTFLTIPVVLSAAPTLLEKYREKF